MCGKPLEKLLEDRKRKRDVLIRTMEGLRGPRIANPADHSGQKERCGGGRGQCGGDAVSPAPAPGLFESRGATGMDRAIVEEALKVVGKRPSVLVAMGRLARNR